MQTSSWFIEKVNGVTGAALCKFTSQFHTLRFTARQCWGRLTKANVSKPYIDQGLHVATNDGLVIEEVNSFRDRHIQHIGDALTLELNFKCVAVIPGALAHFTWHINIWQEVHFNFDCAVTRASFTAPTGDVKAKAPWLITTNLCFRGCSKQFTNIVEDTCVGSRVTARCTTNWRLIHINHFVKVLNSINRLMAPWSIFRLVDLLH